MKCRKCGNEEGNGVYCAKCGYKVKRETFLIILCFVIPVLFFIFSVASIIAGVFFALKTASTMEYASFKSYKVPTVYKVVGKKRNVCSFENKTYSNYGTTRIYYCEDLRDEDIDEYEEYLVNEAGFSVANEHSTVYSKTVDKCEIKVTITNGGISYNFC